MNEMNDPDASPQNIEERRRFLRALSIGMGSLGAAVIGLPLIGYIVAPLLVRVKPQWRPVGSLDKFDIGSTTLVTFMDASPVPWSGVADKTASWLRRTGQKDFAAFSINCTHLGCPVRWEPKAELFMCPCHGGIYYKDGVVAAGPPPLPLRNYPVRVNGNQVEIQTSPIPIT
jgi:menaquinol-cytochrome c reductase iron-sulfur subunit